MKLSGLGRGLQSLIPSKTRLKIAEPTPHDNVFYVEVGKIFPNQNQPRSDFNDAALKELAASIKKYGVLQPLIVSKKEVESERGINITYEIIAGERRWRASKLAGVPHVPVIVKDNFDEGRVRLEVALIENLQREDLNVLEEAEAYLRLAREFGLTQKEIALRVSKSREVIANTLRLLDLPTEMKDAVRSGKLSRTQARTLLSLRDKTEQQKAYHAILSGGATVRNVEQAARDTKVGKPTTTLAYKKRYEELQANLSKNLGSPVMIKSTTNGGKIEIRFATLEELNTIAKTILG